VRRCERCWISTDTLKPSFSNFAKLGIPLRGA
jgi:hypothetical protein